jgi:hypothetical protein
MRAELRITLYSFMAVLTITVQGYAQPQYTVTDLGTFQPNAIAGPWVVGVENGLPTRLNLDTGQKITLGHQGQGGTVYAVIATGEAVGTIKIPGASGSIDAATFWDANGTAYVLPGPLPSYALGMNDAWTVAGYSLSCPGGTRAVRWWPTEGREECLPPVISGAHFGKAIDGQHRVWGQSSNFILVWPVDQPGGRVVQGGLQAAVRGDNEVMAIGHSESLDGSFNEFAAHFAFPPAVTVLPTLLTGRRIFCAATGINRANVTVGGCGKAGTTEPSHAMIWPDTTTVIDLNTVVQAPSTLQWAIGINDAGEIIGTSAGRNWLLTPIAPSLAMRLNQTNVAPGQTLRMALDMHNPGPMLTTDVYVGIILPDGEQVVFLTNLSPLEGQLTTLSSNPRLFARLLQGVSWLANLHATQENYWVYARSGLEANGTYHLVIAWTKPNSLEDGRIDEGDILALDWKAFQFTGPASNLAAKARD